VQVGDVSGPGWRAEQARFMAEVARVLRPGGRALLVVGDGVVDGRAENAPDGIAAAGAAVGLDAVARASQARPLHDRRLAQIFATHPRREHLLLLQKSS
jgi:SAM-dependent methyltransferase